MGKARFIQQCLQQLSPPASVVLLTTALAFTACLSISDVKQELLPQCRLLQIDPPTQTGRLWLSRGVPDAALYRVEWTPPPDRRDACHISATSLDTGIARIGMQEDAPGTVRFYFSGVRTGSTKVVISLGSVPAPVLSIAVTDSLTLKRAIAHRGAGLLAPENTLSGLRLSTMFPTPGVEFDVRLTKDSVPILMHDAATDRTTGFHARVSNLSFSETQQLDAAYYLYRGAKREPPPSLLDVLNLLRSSQIGLFFAEIKHDSAFAPGTEARRVLEVVRQSGVGSQLVVYSTSQQVITALRELDSSIRLGYSQNGYTPTQPLYLASKSVKFMFYPMDSVLHGDSAGLSQLRANGVSLVAYTAATLRQADSVGTLPSPTLVLADSVPALFAPPLAGPLPTR